jgi:hypothetical protein
MITQTRTGLNSRSEANPYNKEGFLPLITAPMNCVVDSTNADIFLQNGLQVCLPRENYNEDFVLRDRFYSMSLSEFIQKFNGDYSELNTSEGPIKICIDTANGNMPKLHETIKEAKKMYGDSLVIMAGNVASVESFANLAGTGADYIRLGIGGGGGCNTTSNVGIGQKDLAYLIKECKDVIASAENLIKGWEDSIDENKIEILNFDHMVAAKNRSKVKIIADGISSYIKQCEVKYGFNDNGYAAINTLIDAGADLVMVGKLFAQCYESAGEKSCKLKTIFHADNYTFIENTDTEGKADAFNDKSLFVKYSGMSTLLEQPSYRDKADINQNKTLRPSEGSVSWIPVRWKLQEWLHGNDAQDTHPYLMGWVNSVKSYMSYVGKTTL